MQDQLLGCLVSVIVGAIGGNVTGTLFTKLSLGMLGNSAARVIGGAIGGIVLGAALGPTGIAGWLGYVLGAIAGSILAILLVRLVMPEK